MMIDHYYDSTKDIHWYHLGYESSKEYTDFYHWLKQRKIRYDYTDMPHHYFVLLFDEDRLAMHEAWFDYIKPVMESEFYPQDYHDSMAP